MLRSLNCNNLSTLHYVLHNIIVNNKMFSYSVNFIHAMYNYYAMLKSHVYSSTLSGRERCINLNSPGTRGGDRSGARSGYVSSQFYFIRRMPRDALFLSYIYLFAIFVIFTSTWFVFLFIRILRPPPLLPTSHAKYTVESSRRKINHAHKVRDILPNYKRKFVFKCKKIITHKCSFYTI